MHHLRLPISFHRGRGRRSRQGHDIELLCRQYPVEYHSNPSPQVVAGSRSVPIPESGLEVQPDHHDLPYTIVADDPYYSQGSQNLKEVDGWDNAYPRSSHSPAPSSTLVPPYTPSTTPWSWTTYDRRSLHQSTFDTKPLMGSSEGHDKDDKVIFVCGINRRKLIWVLLGIGIFFGVVALALGVGLGVGLRDGHQNR